MRYQKNKQSVYFICLFTFFEEFLTAWWWFCRWTEMCSCAGLSVSTFIYTDKIFFHLHRRYELAKKEASGCWYSNAC